MASSNVSNTMAESWYAVKAREIKIRSSVDLESELNSRAMAEIS